MRREVCAAYRGDTVRIKDDLGRREVHFNDSVVLVVAEERVYESHRRRVHSAAGVDAKTAVSAPAQILNGGKNSRFSEKDAHLTGTKRTVSPGWRKLGFSAFGMNIGTSVRPMICHPPGESSG